jgi:hypothetical protein
MQIYAWISVQSWELLLVSELHKSYVEVFTK